MKRKRSMESNTSEGSQEIQAPQDPELGSDPNWLDIFYAARMGKEEELKIGQAEELICLPQKKRKP